MKLKKVPYICKGCKEEHYALQGMIDRGKLFCSMECCYNFKGWGINKVDKKDIHRRKELIINK